MDINLILSAQTLHLAPEVKRGEPVNGIFVVKNVPAKTYLWVTPEQWLILQQFEKPKMVPAVLGAAILERHCLPLGEFYELILKAIKAEILLEPGVGPEPVTAYDWSWVVRPTVLARPLTLLFCVGMLMALVFRPRIPTSVVDVAAGVLLLSATLSFGEFLAGCMLRGAGGEVYRPRWSWIVVPPHFFVDTDDTVMMPRETQALIAMVIPSLLAAAAGVAAWHRPEWAFPSLIGLIISVRPIFGGTLASLFRAGQKRAPSDAEHNFVFPPNRRPEIRARLLARALAHPTTWLRIGYGIVWTLAIVYWVERLGSAPNWSLPFWRANGPRIALGAGGSLVLLGLAYAFWELYHWARERGRARRDTIRLWRQRWFGPDRANLDESGRVKLLTLSPMLSTLPPPQRVELARAMAIRRLGPFRDLKESSDVPTKVSMIVSGKVSLRRKLPTGRTVQVQVLSEGDIIGLHDLADPKFPGYQVRPLTPVTLLTLDRKAAEELIVARVSCEMLSDTILKLPFLRRISLCQNWHLQAVNRFARLSQVRSYAPGEVILGEGQTVPEFFVIFQGDAKVSRERRHLSIIHAGGFFGEIGLMQNSSSNATVTAHNGTRCLSIPRNELLRFVTHNYTVALELEGVSSKRLGRPIFPLRAGDFRSI
jgi:CRP-like cAMP-binding protein